MTDLPALRRDCARKRVTYLQARSVYDEVTRLSVATDLSALRDELGEALLAYYAAHGAFHGGMQGSVGAARISPPN